MSRINVVENRQANPEQETLFDAILGPLGMVPNLLSQGGRGHETGSQPGRTQGRHHHRRIGRSPRSRLRDVDIDFPKVAV